MNRYRDMSLVEARRDMENEDRRIKRIRADIFKEAWMRYANEMYIRERYNVD